METMQQKSNFENLVESKEFAEFTTLLIKITGLAMALNSPEGKSHNKLLGGNRNNKVCLMIRNSTQGLPKCLECDRRHYLLAVRSKAPLIYTCHAGFWDMAVPVFVQGRHIATISSGQVLPAPVSEEGFQALRKRLDWMKISDKTLRSAYESAPYLPREKLRYVMRLLEMFANQLCESLRHIRELEERLEKREIRLAREYIQGNFGNPLLSLSEVADHVGFSKAHFSHLFKQVTKVPFTTFVQECRINAAKHQLTQSDKSVTEICFTCGFNSMTHFNRIFRLFEKVSPGKFRKNLAK